ncbi:hypothetical protein V8C34DRAFT_131109 [Trichoderma compactum]
MDMPMGELGRHRQSQQPRQMRQKRTSMYQSGRTLEFVASSSHGAAGARVHGLLGEQWSGSYASSSVSSFLLLFLCSLCFFSVPIMESLMSRSGAPYRSNLPSRRQE